MVDFRVSFLVGEGVGFWLFGKVARWFGGGGGGFIWFADRGALW